jgi:UDP-N-acetylglucosamine transferase subunit ALG13
MSTFVSVGNAHQAFTRLLDAIAAIAQSLPQPVVVQHGHTVFESPICKAVEFLDLVSFEAAVSEADVLILHAGAGSVIHALCTGKVPIVVPRRAEFAEHVDNHQVEFARRLASTGRVVVVDDVRELEAAIKCAGTMQIAHAGSRPPLVDMVADALSRAAAGAR